MKKAYVIGAGIAGATAARILKNNKWHIKVDDGTNKATIPVNHVHFASSNTGKYNDEHAFIKMFDYARSMMSKQKNAPLNVPSIKDMHAEITAAQHNPDHPLNINKADPSHFVHNNKTNELAHQTYYDFLYMFSRRGMTHIKLCNICLVECCII